MAKDIDIVALDLLQEKGLIPFGEPVYVKTVTHYYEGTLVGVTPQWLVIKDPSRIVWDGRENEYMAGERTPQECEYTPGVKFIGVGAVVEFQQIRKLTKKTI